MDELPPLLLVEDSLRDAELVLAVLAGQRVANEVVHVRDGAEALDYLCRRGPFVGRANGPPAIVMLDLRMPKVDGLEVLRQMKADPELSALPVVMMTSSREEQDVVDSYQLGANAYVVKPPQFGELVSAMAKAGACLAIFGDFSQTPRSPV